MAAESGLITCKLLDSTPHRSFERNAELVKLARQHRAQLVQVQQKRYKMRVSQTPGTMHFFDIPPSCLERAGFAPDNVLFATYTHEIIQLRRLCFDELGF